MIEARGLSRTFHGRDGDVDAVRGIDLAVEHGEIVGFLGPNGAGKTTTQRMLTTLLEPTAGEATVAGADLRREPLEVRRRIGYVAQGGMTEPEARPGEELVDQAMLFGIDRAEAERRGRALLETLDLAGTWDRKIGTLSGGQRRRLDIALGLVHAPGLLFLDEPSTGLDPQARANLWEHIRSLRDERGATVFLTTHYLDEADALCDRLLVIDHGEIVAEGSPEELKRRISGDAVELVLESVADGDGAVEALRPYATGDPRLDGDRVRFTLHSAADELPAALAALDGVTVTGLEVHRPSLDDVFLQVTGRALRDEEVLV
jgi:ABC-2 type transport system ATP-binding protein